MKLINAVFLILALILEVSITTFPLVFLVLLSMIVIFKKPWVFAVAFILGLFLDIMLFKTIGITSAYFLVFLFLVILYQSKFEIKTNYFILASSFLGSFGFLLVLGYNNSIILESILSSVFGLFIFIAYKYFENNLNIASE